jgi:Uma2 family endonuclease
MATSTLQAPDTVEDIVERLGSIPLSRIRATPPMGTATEADVLAADAQGLLCELVDGTLVEKAMGYGESGVAIRIDHFLLSYCEVHDVGNVTGADGMVRLFPGLVRIPDVAFVSWARLPDRAVVEQSLPDLVPDLAVEVLSESNTPREMARKRAEYFRAGVRFVWIVDCETQTVDVYRSEQDRRTLTIDDTLHCEELLPGFGLPLRKLFRSRS